MGHHGCMGELLPMPKAGDVFIDVRGDDRTMRISRYDDQGVVVVSIWAERVCRASFRLPLEDVPRMLAALGDSTDEPPVQELTQFLELDDHPTVAIPEAS